MDIQKLFNLIDRVSDTSNALRMPSHRDLVDLIKTATHVEFIYANKIVLECMEALSNSQYSTISEKRLMLKAVLHQVVKIYCEVEDLDLIYRFHNTSRCLHVGIVTRETHNGTEAVYGIRSSDHQGDTEPVWEYLPCESAHLFDAIEWRMRALNRISIYGYHDPALIGKPEEPTLANQW